MRRRVSGCGLEGRRRVFASAAGGVTLLPRKRAYGLPGARRGTASLGAGPGPLLPRGGSPSASLRTWTSLAIVAATLGNMRANRGPQLREQPKDFVRGIELRF
jgi:hypothetical protein